MPAIPIPQPTPIERAGWNTDYQGVPAAAANAVGSPPNALMQANEIANQQAQNNMRTAQAAGGVQDLQDKQRSMQLSMLSGILNEPDPEKQRDLIGKLVPLANKMNPSYQIDSTVGVPEIRALVQSQVSPTEQATLANSLQRAQMVNGLKAEVMSKDALGNPVITNKTTGEVRYPNAQESAYYEASGQLPEGQESGQPAPQSTGIFPNMAQTQPQGVRPAPQANPLNPTQQVQPALGFDQSSLMRDPNALKQAQKNTAAIEANRQQKATLINDIRSNIEQLEPELEQTKGGGYNAPLLQLGKIIGTDQGVAADAASTNAQGLALNLSKLQQIGSSGRTTVAALQTLLNSKPDPYNHYQANNLDNLNHIKGTVENYDAENSFLDAYKDASRFHVVDDNAYKLYDALQKQFPITTVDDKGHTTFNAQNVQALKDAIPDALQNPTKYLNAKGEAQNSLKQPSQQNKPASGLPNLQPGNTIYKGHLYLGGDPSAPTSWKSVTGGASGEF